MVRGLRARFELATQPVPNDDLALGQAWDCHYYSALAGSKMVGFFPDQYQFDLVDVDDSGWGSVALHGEGMPLQFDEGSLRIQRRDHTGIYSTEYVRVDTVNKRLLVEVVARECSTYECLFRLVEVSGIAGSWAPLQGYRECKLR